MSIDAKIAELLAAAAPLRELDEDDPAKDRLGAIVDEINRLRSLQADAVLSVELAEAQIPVAQSVEPVKRGPGRPRKAVE